MDFANDEFEFPEKSTIAVRILEIQDLLLQASGIKKEALKQILPHGKNTHFLKNISINLGFMMFYDKNAGILFNSIQKKIEGSLFFNILYILNIY